jgi:hypothetical protein
MTGKPDLNFPAFKDKARELRESGDIVVNPAELNVGVEGAPWQYYMRADISALVTKCDAIHMLPGWWQSKGARLEWYIATQLGMRIEGAHE